MKRKSFENTPCPIAQCTNVLGDWWIPMILRETLYGIDTFNDFQQNLGISKNILNKRLQQMVNDGLLCKTLYEPNRYRYKLTEKGRDAIDILAAMIAWSNKWAFRDGQHPIELRDPESGRSIQPLVVDSSTRQPLDYGSLSLAPGPGFPSSDSTLKWRFGVNKEMRISLP